MLRSSPDRKWTTLLLNWWARARLLLRGPVSALQLCRSLQTKTQPPKPTWIPNLLVKLEPKVCQSSQTGHCFTCFWGPGKRQSKPPRRSSEPQGSAASSCRPPAPTQGLRSRGKNWDSPHLLLTQFTLRFSTCLPSPAETWTLKHCYTT